MTDYSDYYYDSADGLRLYARDYCPAAPRDTLLCMHGLTRNSADFADIADHLAEDYRLIVVDQRGRGLSQWDSNSDNYQPLVYVQDMFHLLDRLDLERVICLGTSMGGLMTMIMASLQPQRIRAAILNDIGPVIAEAGLQRIKGYVGKTRVATSWDDAVAITREINGKEFPDFEDADWQNMARGMYRENEAGVPVLAYDPALSRPIDTSEETAAPPDLWPAFEALLPVPTLLIRGALSDILAPDCVAEMQRRKPDLRFAEIERRGHAPSLAEPQCIAAIDAFLGDLGGE